MTPTAGLTASQAAERRIRFGQNAMPERPPDPAWRRLLRQFQSPLIYLLLVALAFDLGLWIYEGGHGWPIEVLTIAAILVLNAALGLYQEQRSEAALARLKALAAPLAWVMRDGRLVRVPSATLVPGDVVRLEAGDRVPADGVLVEPFGVMLDESILTGESVPIDKGAGEKALSGTLLVRGRTYVEVTRIGSASAMGRLAGLLSEIQTSKTPLERRVDRLGRQIARGVLGIAAVLAIGGFIAEGTSRAVETIVFAVALAVAAVPEGLPAVLTVALALGVERMAGRKAIVRRLSAVESLGSVTVIATDKTGTLTENRMDVRSLDSTDPDRAMRAIVLANDADVATGAGDPLDAGALRFAAAHGVDVRDERAAHPVVSGRPFDSAWKYVRATVAEDDGLASYLKGAPDVVLDRCDLSPAERTAWTTKADAYAADGLRVLAIAWAPGEVEQDLRCLGLLLFWDPPRPEVADAIRETRAAGIRVVMITGDHPATAQAIARQIGLPGDRVLTGDALDRLSDGDLSSQLRDVHVFARVRPEQKLRLVEAFAGRGDIVAMTGDGVNDAPALKRSDVGVAMGQRGSDVSREVADLVLLDDNFATLAGAVAEGRSIYENIRSFLRFLLSTNLSEVLVVSLGAALAFALGLRSADGALMLPLTAAQILWINLVTDGLPALALAFDRTPGLMRDPPRAPDAPLLDAPSIRFIAGAGTAKALLALGVLGLVPWLGYDPVAARAATFHMMAIGQLLFTYPSRRSTSRPLRNRLLHAAVLTGIGVQLLAAGTPMTARMLSGAALPIELWALVGAAACIAWATAEVIARMVKMAKPVGSG